MPLFSEVIVYISPFFFYYSFAFVLGKTYEWIFNAESIWQSLWGKVIDVFGEEKGTYSVWVLNSYTYALYWTFGILLLILELSKTPKALEIFKIQKEKGLERIKNVMKVS